MITADGWLDWALRVPGPADKCYSQPCQSMGYVPHSAVGYYQGWLGRLFSTARLPNGRYTKYAAASVTGFIRYSGIVIQHYPLGVSCWASGNRHANVKFNAFENEGGWLDHDEPLTVPQIEANIRIIKDMMIWKGLKVAERVDAWRVVVFR